MQNSRLPSPDSDLVRLNGMYVCMQIFMSGVESALISSMGNEIISLRLLNVLDSYSHQDTGHDSLCINPHQNIFVCLVLVLFCGSLKIPKDHNYSLFVLDRNTPSAKY